MSKIGIMINDFLQNRQIEILEALIREHLKNGEPISSKALQQKQRLNLSSSTIRHYFFQLTQDGFLEQPHVSSGRIPTDKAWQIFISKVLNDWDLFDNMADHMVKEIERVIKPQRNLSLSDISGWLSDKSKSFSFCYDIGNGRIYKNGHQYLFVYFDSDQLLEVKQVAQDLDGLDDKIKNFRPRLGVDIPEVFIGKDNPFIDSPHFSALVNCVDDFGLIGLIGPKTILSEKNIALLKAAEELITV